MPRTSENAVLEIIKTKLTTPQILAFINDANLWVTEELGTASLSDDRLELIERYLACAFIRIRDLGLKEWTVKDVREQYQVDPDVNEYLKHAAAFDPTDTIRRTFLSDGNTGWTVIAKAGTGFVGEE